MPSIKHKEAGSFLLEALIGLLIFSMGALAMIALQANGIAAQTDAQYRIEAAKLVDQIIGNINAHATRATPALMQDALEDYALNTQTNANCNFSGGSLATAGSQADTDIPNWVTAITTTAATKLPGSTTAMQQILVDTGTYNKVTVTVCWQTASDTVARKHSVIAYVN
jgi:type IV pilus assembly protein PilV